MSIAACCFDLQHNAIHGLTKLTKSVCFDFLSPSFFVSVQKQLVHPVAGISKDRVSDPFSKMLFEKIVLIK